jgi:hypothetical protein
MNWRTIRCRAFVDTSLVGLGLTFIITDVDQAPDKQSYVGEQLLSKGDSLSLDGDMGALYPVDLWRSANTRRLP